MTTSSFRGMRASAVQPVVGSNPRDGVFRVTFVYGLSQLRGPGGEPQQVPPMPEAEVYVRDGVPEIKWKTLPGEFNPEISLQDFEAEVLNLVNLTADETAKFR